MSFDSCYSKYEYVHIGDPTHESDPHLSQKSRRAVREKPSCHLPLLNTVHDVIKRPWLKKRTERAVRHHRYRRFVIRVIELVDCYLIQINVMNVRAICLVFEKALIQY